MSNTSFIRIFLSLTFIGAIFSCGMVTHSDISQRGFYNFKPESKNGVDYKSFIAKNPSFFLAGSPWPDWGYSCGFSDSAEAAHWPPFIRTYIKYLKEKHQPGDERYAQLVSFLFGVESHGIADVLWHWGKTDNTEDAEGFLNSMSHGDSDCEDDWRKCHTLGDEGADLYLSYRGGFKWMSKSWRIPFKELNEIYTSIGLQAPIKTMTECAIKMYLGTHLERPYAIAELVKDEIRSSFLAENVDSWFHGGIDDMAIHANWEWQNVIKIIEGTETEYNNNRRLLNSKTNLEKATLQKKLIEIINTDFEGFKDLLGVDYETKSNGDFEITHKNEINEKNINYLIYKVFKAAYPKEKFDPKILYFKNDKLKPKNVSEASTAVKSNIPYSYFGKSVTFGDFDGDGKSEMIIGAPGFGYLQEGAVYLTNENELSKIDFSKPLLKGPLYSRFGFSLTTADLNHDGIDDLIVSAPSFGNNGPSNKLEDSYPKNYYGKVYVYFGVKGVGIKPNSQPDVEIVTNNDLELFFNLGFFLSSSDCDGDGFDDLLIGSPYAEKGGNKKGSAAVITKLSSDSKVFNVEDSQFFAVGENNYNEFGYSMTCYKQTLIVGAPGWRPNNSKAQAVGAVYGYNFEDKSLRFSIFSDKAQGKFGESFDIKQNLFAIGAPSYNFKDNDKKDYQSGKVFFFEFENLVVNSDLSKAKAQFINANSRARYGKKVKFADHKLLISAPLYSQSILKVETGRIYSYSFSSILSSTGKINNDYADSIYEGSIEASRFGDDIFVSREGKLFSSAPLNIESELSGALFELN